MRYATLDEMRRSEVVAERERQSVSWRELASAVDYDHSCLSKFFLGKQDRIREGVLRGVVEALGLDVARYIPQYRLELSDAVIEDVTERVRLHLVKLSEEVGPLRGTAFSGFIGIRVSGTVEKIYEGSFGLNDQASSEIPAA